MRFTTFADKIRTTDPNAAVLISHRGDHWKVESVHVLKDGTVVIRTGPPT